MTTAMRLPLIMGEWALLVYRRWTWEIAGRPQAPTEAVLSSPTRFGTPVGRAPIRLCLVRRLGQELVQILLPRDRPGVRAVPVSVLADRQQCKFAVLEARALFFCDAELGRINKIICRIDPHHRGGDNV